MNRILVTFLLVVTLLLVAQSWLNAQLDSYRGEPAPAVVTLAVTPVEINPALCPGDVLRYDITLNVREPSVAEIDWNIRNLDTDRTEVQSETVRTIYERAGVIRSQVSWQIPARLPATNTRPERPWVPGQYRRLIALTGIEGLLRASVISIDFRIKDNCNE